MAGYARCGISLQLSLVILASLLLAGKANAQEVSGEKPRKTVTPVVISTELRSLGAGEPLSERTLVQRPTPGKGVVSWSIETRRHRGLLYGVAISPDNKWLASGGIDGIIRIWNLETGEFTRALVGHDSYVFGLAWSPDGNTLASAGSWDYTARLWDTRSGQMLRKFKHEGYVSRVTWSADGRVLFVGGTDSGAVLLWDVIRGVSVGKKDFGQTLLTSTWAPDGHAFAVSARQGLAQILDGSTYQMKQSIGDEVGDINGMAWSPDSKFIAVSNVKGTRIWDDTAGTFIGTLAGPAHAVAWSPDGKTLAISPNGGAVQLWDVETAKAIKTLPITATNLYWSPDGSVIVGQISTGASVFDVKENKVRFQLASGYLPQAAWARNGRVVLFGVGTKTLSSWEIGLNKPRRTFEGHTGVIHAAALSPTGKLLATASADKTVKIWDIATGGELQTLQGHTAAVNAVAWSANGKTLATGAADKTVRLWNTATGELTNTLEGHRDSVAVVAWGSKALASGSLDQNVHIWNPQNGQITRLIPMFTPVLSLAWGNDGTILAGGGTGVSLFVWNSSNGNLLKKLEQAGSPPSVSAVAWPANLGMIASGRGNHTVQLWDLQTDKVHLNLKAMAPVLSVGWSQDGKTVLAGTQDRSVRSWDAASGLLRATVVAEEERAAIVTAEGNYRSLPEGESDLICIIETATGQVTHPIADLATKFRIKNNPSFVKLTSE